MTASLRARATPARAKPRRLATAMPHAFWLDDSYERTSACGRLQPRCPQVGELTQRFAEPPFPGFSAFTETLSRVLGLTVASMAPTLRLVVNVLSGN